jgi:hypothetical protein
MLTKMEVRNVAGGLLTFELDDVTDGYVLKDVEGLDPVKATIASSDFASVDGAQFQSARRVPRNVIISLGLEPDYATQTVRGLRTQLYDWFMPKSDVKLRFYDSDAATVEIEGKVESCGAPLFSKEPGVDISVMCFRPDFVELTENEYDGNTVSTTTEFSIDYGGSVEAGIEFALLLDRSLSDFTIYHRPPDNIVRSMEFSASLLADDVLRINTNVGSKSVILTRSAIESSLLYGLQGAPSWIQLQPGLNYLRVYATGAAIPFTITYTNRHGGL